MKCESQNIAICKLEYATVKQPWGEDNHSVESAGSK